MASIIKEEWKEIKNYEGLYKVSNLGTVASIARNVVSQQGAFRCTSTKNHAKFSQRGECTRHIKSKTMTPQIKKKTGRKCVILLKEGKRLYHDIAYLVAVAFIDNKYAAVDTKYLDGDILNNIYTNIAWEPTLLNELGEPLAICNTCEEHYDRSKVNYNYRKCPKCVAAYKKEKRKEYLSGKVPLEHVDNISEAKRKEASDASWLGSASIYW